MYILYSILILSFLVIIHELGHYFAAKWAKVKVEEFGLGYPPKALRLFKDKETEWTLNWIPFGGFVKLAGEDGAPKEKDEPFAGKFYQVTIVKKLVIILAGATVNFIFGVLAFAFIFSIMGIPEYQARVESVAPNSPAAIAGIPENVRIDKVTIDGVTQDIKTTDELISYIQANAGKNVTLTTTGQCTSDECENAQQEFTAYLRKPEEIPTGEGSLGIAFQPPVLKKYVWYEMPFRGATYGLVQAFQLSGLIYSSLYTVIVQAFSQGNVPQELSGPVGIVQQAGQSGVYDQGILGALSFAGMLSINLAVMNILPIPPLDGGRAVFIILERWLGRKRTEKVELVFNYGGYIALLGLIIFVTARDIFNIFS